MTKRNITLSLYADVASISEKMLIATKAENWELLSQLEAECAARIEDVKQADKNVPLSDDELRQKVYYIERILATDREIRVLVEPWMTRLAQLVHSGSNRQKLRNAYGSNRHG